MMGMNSEKLSQRSKQPGDDQSYQESEGNFLEALERLINPEIFEIAEKPKDLRKMLPNNHGIDDAEDAYGVVPEVLLLHKKTGRKLFFEVKKQGKGGNADERACKHHTVQFQQSLKEFTKFEYHSFVTIFCEELATLPKYLVKHAHFFEPDHYFCWKEYELAPLARFLDHVIRSFLLVDDPNAHALSEEGAALLEQ